MDKRDWIEGLREMLGSLQEDMYGCFEIVTQDGKLYLKYYPSDDKTDYNGGYVPVSEIKTLLALELETGNLEMYTPILSIQEEAELKEEDMVKLVQYLRSYESACLTGKREEYYTLQLKCAEKMEKPERWYLHESRATIHNETYKQYRFDEKTKATDNERVVFTEREIQEMPLSVQQSCSKEQMENFDGLYTEGWLWRG